MAINVGNAIAAYARQSVADKATGLEPRSRDPAQSFSDLLGQAVHGAIETGKTGETMSARGVAGTADLREVVTAVTNAEVTLQTALAIRDRVVQAYKDVMSMPI